MTPTTVNVFHDHSNARSANQTEDVLDKYARKARGTWVSAGAVMTNGVYERDSVFQFPDAVSAQHFIDELSGIFAVVGYTSFTNEVDVALGDGSHTSGEVVE